MSVLVVCGLILCSMHALTSCTVCSISELVTHFDCTECQVILPATRVCCDAGMWVTGFRTVNTCGQSGTQFCESLHNKMKRTIWYLRTHIHTMRLDNVFVFVTKDILDAAGFNTVNSLTGKPRDPFWLSLWDHGCTCLQRLQNMMRR